MRLLWRILQMIGLCRRDYTEEDIRDAEVDDAFWEHQRATTAAKDVAACRGATNKKLDIAIEGSRQRSKEFENFERMIRSETHRVRRDHQ